MIAAPKSVPANLGDMTKRQLLDYGKSQGVTGLGAAMNKADIRAVIENAIT